MFQICWILEICYFVKFFKFDKLLKFVKFFLICLIFFEVVKCYKFVKFFSIDREQTGGSEDSKADARHSSTRGRRVQSLQRLCWSSKFTRFLWNLSKAIGKKIGIWSNLVRHWGEFSFYIYSTKFKKKII